MFPLAVPSWSSFTLLASPISSNHPSHSCLLFITPPTPAACFSAVLQCSGSSLPTFIQILLCFNILCPIMGFIQAKPSNPCHHLYSCCWFLPSATSLFFLNCHHLTWSHIEHLGARVTATVSPVDSRSTPRVVCYKPHLSAQSFQCLEWTLLVLTAQTLEGLCSLLIFQSAAVKVHLEPLISDCRNMMFLK